MFKHIIPPMGLAALVTLSSCNNDEPPKRSDYNTQCYVIAGDSQNLQCLHTDLTGKATYSRGRAGCFYVPGHKADCQGSGQLAPELVEQLAQLLEAENNFLFEFDTKRYEKRKK